MYDRLLQLVVDTPELVQILQRMQFRKRSHLSWVQEAAENGGILPNRKPPNRS